MANPLTVSELTTNIKSTLSKSYKQVCVVGEVSNFSGSKGSSGTVFFTLKDSATQINGVIFDYAGNAIPNGKQVKVVGDIMVFPSRGTYNISVKKIELIGLGKLHQAYVELKEHYTKLGYFNDGRKKMVKEVIRTIGIITSQDGAALQDFIYALKKNGYVGKLYVKHSIVQGKDCPGSIVKGLVELDKMDLDVLVVTRGGGSFEDLFGFSDSKVIDQIYLTKTLVVSAVGHQIDYMLSDFVADIRAPTPTSAGELLSCKKVNLDEISVLEEIIKEKIMNMIRVYDSELKMICNGVSSVGKIMENILYDVDKLCTTLNLKIQNKLLLLCGQLSNIVVEAESHVIIDKNKNIIKSINDFNKIKNKDKITIKFFDGQVTFMVTGIKINK